MNEVVSWTLQAQQSSKEAFAESVRFYQRYIQDLVLFRQPFINKLRKNIRAHIEQYLSIS
jgi:hypothetical protein